MKPNMTMMALVMMLAFTSGVHAQEQTDIAAAQKALDAKAAAHANDAPTLLKENNKLRDQVAALNTQIAELKTKLATEEKLLAKAADALQEKTTAAQPTDQADAPLIEPILSPKEFPQHDAASLLSYPVRPGSTGFLHGLVVVLQVVDKTSFIGSAGAYEERGDVKAKFLFTGVDTNGMTTSGGGGSCLIAIPSQLKAVETVTIDGETFFKLEPAPQPQAHSKK